MGELRNLERDDVELYVMHLKPNSMEEIKREMKELLPDVKILTDGDEVIIN